MYVTIETIVTRAIRGYSTNTHRSFSLTGRRAPCVFNPGRRQDTRLGVSAVSQANVVGIELGQRGSNGAGFTLLWAV